MPESDWLVMYEERQRRIADAKSQGTTAPGFDLERALDALRIEFEGAQRDAEDGLHDPVTQQALLDGEDYRWAISILGSHDWSTNA